MNKGFFLCRRSTPYLLPFLKIRINSLRRSQHFPYKTLGITSLGSFEKQFSTRAAPVSGLLTGDGPAEVVLTNEREKTRTVSNTGAGKASSPIIFRRDGAGRPPHSRLLYDPTQVPLRNRMQSLSFQMVTNTRTGKDYAFRPCRTHGSTGGIKRIIAREPEKITRSRKQN
jgi:hypothetical protein